MQNNLKQLWTLLMPSWLSGLVAAVFSISVVVGTVIISNYQGSHLQQELFDAKNGASTSSLLGFQTIADNLTRNTILNNAPLFLFWAVLGLIVYFFATSVWSALTSAEELREEMNYVNATKHNLVRTAALHVVLRLAFLVLWLGYLQLFLKVLLPYVLDAARVAADGLSLSSVAVALLAVIVLFVSIQVHFICMRLVLLRGRVFGNSAEI